MNKNKSTFRMYKTKGDYRLIPIYNNCQIALNQILNNKSYTSQLKKIELNNVIFNKNFNKKIVRPKLAGDLWKEIKNIVGNPLIGKVPDSWYTYMIYHNIIQLLKSRSEQIKIYNLLKQNDFKIDSVLRNNLKENNLFPTNAYLKVLRKARQMPTLPKSKKFIMDFSVSTKQMFKISEDQLGYDIKIHSYQEAKKKNISQWINVDIYLPPYIRESFNGRIAKPQFYYDNSLDDYVFAIPCEIDIKKNNFKNILGVDLGLVKPYSATVIYENGNISNEYTPSNELLRLNNKHKNLNRQINNLYNKIERVKAYNQTSLKQELRLNEYKLTRNKRTRLKNNMAKLIAVELVTIALKNECGTIHLEKLNWLNSKGNKWQHSLIQTKISELAELYGIKVKLVSCSNTSKTHPITKEKGIELKRDILFSNGDRIDRDKLASINIGIRSTNISILKFALKHQQSIRLRRSVSRKKLIKQNILKTIGDNKIALFSHNKATLDFALVSLTKNMLTYSNVYFPRKLHIAINF